mgnify:CR=1 FL=1
MRNMFRSLFAAALICASIESLPRPASALERLVFQMPLLETQFTFELGMEQTTADLLSVNPDLAELDRAMNGSVKALLDKIFHAPLPLEATALLEGGAGQPLLEQALRAMTFVIEVKGLPDQSSGSVLAEALIRANQRGKANLLGLLREIPAEEAVVDLSRLNHYAKRLQNNLKEAAVLADAMTPATVSPALRAPLRRNWQRVQQTLSVDHRPEPLPVLMLIPEQRSNRRLVVISHGLWDEAQSFEGWAEMLAAHGYTVLLPDHPGSDRGQQQAMLAGELPPPGPDELRLRPLDITALLDAVASGQILEGASLNLREVGVVGHSWGATTALQLIGLQTTDQKLLKRCEKRDDLERNLSWVLQCSWLSHIDQASLSDPRVQAVVAVSPPLRLLFDPARQGLLTGKVLLITGTRDWVVPPGPEALTPMRNSGVVQGGHRLVLVQGGDHFNLRAPSDPSTPAILAPLILGWLNEQLAVPGAVTFTEGTWGDQNYPLVDVSDSL